MEGFLLCTSTFRHPIPFSASPSPRAVISNPIAFFRARVHCGLRDGARKPLWRGKVISKEAIQVVQAIKLAKASGNNKLAEVFRNRTARLLKDDLLDVLKELQRQNECEIALQVFTYMKKEAWYKPDSSLYGDMILMMGKNKLIEIAENLFLELEKEGGVPLDTRAYNEMIGAFLRVGNVEKAMCLYKSMKDYGCNPDKLTFIILVRNLEMAGEEDLADAVKKDCIHYVDSPKKFLEELVL